MVLNVPINGKATPVVAEGSKDGFFYVLNAKNGSQVPNFKINTQPTLDPSGQGIAMNALASTQPIPTGASFCAVIVDYSPAGLAQCGFPANTVATEYGGTGERRTSSRTARSSTRPTAGRSSGRSSSRRTATGAYFVFGGAGGGGNFGYPPSSYSPIDARLLRLRAERVGRALRQGTGAARATGQPQRARRRRGSSGSTTRST